MNENEFDLDFDFEKEYGFIDPPKEEEKAPQEENDDFDLRSILESDFGSDSELVGSEYETDFDYGPDIEFDYGPETEDFLQEPEAPAAAQEPELPEIDLSDIPDLDIPDAEDPNITLPDEEPVQELPTEDQPAPRQRRERRERRSPAEQETPAEGGRRRKPVSPMRKFKNEQLPLIIMGIAALLCVVFIFGSIGRAISVNRANKDAIKDASDAALSKEEQLAKEAETLLKEAAALAAGYDYQGAIDKLDSFSGDTKNYTDIIARRSEYEQAKSHLVAHNDPSEVVNLSFHALIADPSRAFSNQQYGKSYNMNFVTIDEFQAILEQLYANNYVLVDMDSFIAETTTGDTTTYESKTLYLPDGKKPVMITETMADYFDFMVDSDNDGQADKGGAGFASRLVLDDNGDVKAELINSDGTVSVGNYELIPILNQFIADHPDFCYQGARATIALCGYDGVFGYKTNPDVIDSQGQDYYNAQVAEAKKVVAALRADGYEFASYTYGNVNYGDKNASEIQADVDLWMTKVAPVVGEVDTLVYAKNSDIASAGTYSGSKYNVLYQEGFRYFITSGSKATATVTSEYVRQTRVMVTGTQMAHASSMYTSYFDAKSVLNNLRGDVPQ